MTENHNTWATHLRRVGAGVVPPTPADPHVMAAVAVRRTRVRRAVVAGVSVTGAVAAIAGTAFALGGSAQPPEALPGAAMVSATEAAAVGTVPEGWHVEHLRDLSFALPPEFEGDGPNPPEPGEESWTWSDDRDPDVHRSVHVEVVTPEYAYYDATAGGTRSTPGDGAEEFEVAGAGVATVEDMTEELKAAAGTADGRDAGTPGPDSPRVARIIVHPAGSDARYVIHVNVPADSDDLLDGLRESLRVG
ncbi:hypothetical protein [Myceligenerans indicum]|uniref:DUF4245 domain-containing protein n=1 Tax=Myceligenerans indicum TaxID=2593663 RepID=A0ABS1LGU8_9MICO|nr:hypothetical protein [Myceligenerans indicum]MBL0884822.1 hypothetical protein [Myceligenerans indicum]